MRYPLYILPQGHLSTWYILRTPRLTAVVLPTTAACSADFPHPGQVSSERLGIYPEGRLTTVLYC